jgi:hypothetical protein
MEKVEKFCLIEECFLKLFLFKNILKFKPGKKSIKPIKIFKKSTGLVRFQFYKPEIEKTEPTQTEKN